MLLQAAGFAVLAFNAGLCGQRRTLLIQALLVAGVVLTVDGLLGLIRRT
jgi:hypothetical protein